METDTSKKFSPSKLDTYKDCPRRYRYRYVDKISRDVKSVEAFLGGCVHKAFEGLYTGLLHGKRMTCAEAIQVFEAEWEAGWSEDVVIRHKEYAAADWKNIGRDCVRTYYQANDPFDRDKTVEVEKRIGFSLEAAGQPYRIEGFIDRLALAPDGAFEIHDYKTSRTLPTQQDKDQDRQLAIYELAVRDSWPDAKEVRLIWHFVRFGKSIQSTRSLSQREELKKEISALIEAIKHDHEFLPRKSPLCDWCEYRDLCPLWSHGEKVAALEPEQRRRDSGVKLVDQFAALEFKKRELREELRRLEKEQQGLEPELIGYAEAFGVEVISGSDGEVSVINKDEYKFPTKTHSPDALESLERELKASPLWGEISHLDGHLLMEGYKRKVWALPLLELVESLIGRYVKRLQEKALRFRRKKEPEDE